MAAAAGIAAAGSIVGGIASGKGAKKAAKIQAQQAANAIAAQQQLRAELTALSQPTIDRGNAAGATFAGLLGVGGDAQASKAALDTFRGSSGYQDLLDTGLAAVNANAYARGMGNSGAALKALQAKGTALADQSQQTYMGNLNALVGYGNQAVGNVAGVATNAVNGINAANQTAADAASNAALVKAQGIANAVQGVSTGLSSALGSSFSNPLLKAGQAATTGFTQTSPALGGLSVNYLNSLYGR